MKSLAILLLFAFTVTCKLPHNSSSVSESIGGDANYSVYNAGNRIAGWQGQSHASDHFLDKIQPILNKRCVACHGCDEAPCQLNLQSYKRLQRGLHPTPLFSGKRLKATNVSRNDLLDQMSREQWRHAGYLPVVGSEAGANPEQTLLYQFLLRREQNKPGFDPRPLAHLQKNWDDNGAHQCVVTKSQYEDHFKRGFIQTPLTRRFDNPDKVMTVEDYFGQYQTGGMPFAMTPLDPQREYSVLMDWVKNQKASGPSAQAMHQAALPAKPEPIQLWEDFFNRNLPKAEQAARYIYEHAFTAHLALDELPGEFYKLVRSRTQHGPISEISTTAPYDAPGVPRVFYRLRKITESIVQKKHIVWRLNLKKREHFINLFWKTPWPDETTRPQYGSQNPFEYFRTIPAKLRWQFLMENSQIIAGAMVQGSVCIGSRATYAIGDHFWVWFLRPEVDPSVQNPMLGLTSWDDLNTAPIQMSQHRKSPQSRQSVISEAAQIGADTLVGRLFSGLKNYAYSESETLQIAHHFVRSSRANQRYTEAWEKELRKLLASKGRTGLSVQDLWDGHDINRQGDADPYYTNGNPNAWLSINRHRRNSTVQLGPEGGTPQSIWVLSYSNFERLYYNLVAHYQEWESLDHKLATWRHMSYVRLEGEDLAISFLPEQVRENVRARFTQGLGEIKQMKFFPPHSVTKYPGFAYGPRKAETPKVRSSDPDTAIQDLVDHAKKHLKDVQGDHAGQQNAVDGPDGDIHAKLMHLANDSRRQGADFAAFMPDVSYIRIRRSSGDQVFSLIADRAYQAHNIIFIEDQNRLPQNDVLSVYRGFVGAFPNVFFDLREDQVSEFINTVRHLTSTGSLGRGASIDETAFLRTLGKYAVSRTSAQFWQFYDWLHSYKGHKRPGVDPVAEAIIDLQQYVFF